MKWPTIMYSDIILSIQPMKSQLSNSYTMGGDTPRAVASRLSYVQVDKYDITILYHLH